MKKEFLAPEMQITVFLTEDILTYSIDDLMEWEGIIYEDENGES